jgi:hypothetical protein
VRASHRALSSAQFAQEPFHLAVIQSHVYLDRSAACNTGGHCAAQIRQRDLAQLALANFQDFKNQLFNVGRANAGRRSLHRNSPIPERLGLEAAARQLIGDVSVFDLLRCRQFQQYRHQEMLALHSSLCLLPQHLLEQNAFVRNVLIYDPEPVAGGGDDEAVVNLAQRAQVREDCQALRGVEGGSHSRR